MLPEAGEHGEEEDILRQSQTDDEKLSRQKVGGAAKFGGTRTIAKGNKIIFIVAHLHIICVFKKTRSLFEFSVLIFVFFFNFECRKW